MVRYGMVQAEELIRCANALLVMIPYFGRHDQPREPLLERAAAVSAVYPALGALSQIPASRIMFAKSHILQVIPEHLRISRIEICTPLS